MAEINTQINDTLPELPEGADTLNAAADTVPPVWGVVIDKPAEPKPAPEPDTSMSWLIAGLLLCFVVVAIRFKNNGKYVVSLWKDITEVRERRNIFDETVKETSFLVLLNVLLIASGAILLGCLMLQPGVPDITAGISSGIFRHPMPRTLPAMVLEGALPAMIIYTLLMFFAYWMVGNVFSDSLHTRMWVRGYGATNGILSVCLFPVALLTLCYPSITRELLIAGAVFFILAKSLFLYKGFRIFFSQRSSWVLFLYYLCSLEIVPLVLLFAGTQFLGRIL